jgi:hypothetical protein
MRSMNMEEAYKVVVDRLEREHGNIYVISDFRLSEWLDNGWFVRFTCRARGDFDPPVDRLAFFAGKDGDLEMTAISS